MEEADKGWLMSRKGVSGLMFILISAQSALSQTKGRETVVCMCVCVVVFVIIR